MDWLTIFVIVLVAAIIWAVVELALTIRKARGSVDGIVEEVNGTIRDLDQVVQKVDATVTDVNPAVKQLEPLLTKAETTIDAVTLDLLHLNDTIADINTVTGAGAKATNAVTGVVDKAASAVSGAVGRLSSRGDSEAARLAEGAEDARAAIEGAVVDTREGDAGYFTYPGAPVADDTKADDETQAPSDGTEPSHNPGDGE